MKLIITYYFEGQSNRELFTDWYVKKMPLRCFEFYIDFLQAAGAKEIEILTLC